MNLPDSPKSRPGDKPAAVVANGLGKPKPDAAPMPAGDGEQEPDETKLSAERALVSHAEENCGNCTHYNEQDGTCEEVDGVFQPDDRCWAAYWPKPTGAPQEQSAEQPVGAGEYAP